MAMPQGPILVLSESLLVNVLILCLDLSHRLSEEQTKREVGFRVQRGNVQAAKVQ